MLASSARYPGVDDQTLEAIQNDIVLELFDRVDEAALELRRQGELQRYFDVRAIASAIFAEGVRR